MLVLLHEAKHKDGTYNKRDFFDTNLNNHIRIT